MEESVVLDVATSSDHASRTTSSALASQRTRRVSEDAGIPPLSARSETTASAVAPTAGAGGIVVRAQPRTGADIQAYEKSMLDKHRKEARQARQRGQRAAGGDISEEDEDLAQQKPQELHLKILSLHGLLLRPSIQAAVIGGSEEEEYSAAHRDRSASDSSRRTRSSSVTDSSEQEGSEMSHPPPRRLIRLSRNHKPHTSVEAFITSKRALKQLEDALEGKGTPMWLQGARDQPQPQPPKKIRRPPGGSTLLTSYSASPVPAFPLTLQTQQVQPKGAHGLTQTIKEKVGEGLLTAERMLERAATLAAGMAGGDHAADEEAVKREHKLSIIRSWCSQQKRGKAGTWTSCYYPAATHALPGKDPAVNETLVLPSVLVPSCHHDDDSVVILELLQFDPLYAASRHCVGFASIPLKDLVGQPSVENGAASNLAGELLQPPVAVPRASPRGGDIAEAIAGESEEESTALKRKKQAAHPVLLSAHQGSAVSPSRVGHRHDGIFFTLPIIAGSGNISLEASLREEVEMPAAATTAAEAEHHAHLPLPIAPLLQHPQELGLITAVVAAAEAEKEEVEGHKVEPPAVAEAVAAGPHGGGRRHHVLSLSGSSRDSGSLESKALAKSESSGSLASKDTTGAAGEGAPTATTTGPSPLFSLPEGQPSSNVGGGRTSAETAETGTRLYLLSPDQAAAAAPAVLANTEALQEEFGRIAEAVTSSDLDTDNYAAAFPTDYEPIRQQEEREGQEQQEEVERHERAPLLIGHQADHHHRQQGAEAEDEQPIFRGVNSADMSPWDPFGTATVGAAAAKAQRPRVLSALSSFSSASALSSAQLTSQVFRQAVLSSTSKGIVGMGGVGFSLIPALALTAKQQHEPAKANASPSIQELHLARLPPPEIHQQPSQTGSMTPASKPLVDTEGATAVGQDRTGPHPPPVETWVLRAHHHPHPHPVVPGPSATQQQQQQQGIPHPAAGTGLFIAAAPSTDHNVLPQPNQTPLPAPNQTPLPEEQQAKAQATTSSHSSSQYYAKTPLSAEKTADWERIAGQVDKSWDKREDVLSTMTRTIASKQPSQPGESKTDPSPLTRRVLELVRHDISCPSMVQQPLPMGSPAPNAHSRNGGASSSSASSSSSWGSSSFSYRHTSHGSGSTTSDSAQTQGDRNQTALANVGRGTNFKRVRSVTRFRRVYSEDDINVAMQQQQQQRRQEQEEKQGPSAAALAPYLTSPGTRAEGFAHSERKFESLELTPGGQEFKVTATSTPTATFSAPVRAARSEKISFSRIKRRLGETQGQRKAETAGQTLGLSIDEHQQSR
jgi:hypothetical protein